MGSLATCHEIPCEPTSEGYRLERLATQSEAQDSRITATVTGEAARERDVPPLASFCDSESHARKCNSSLAALKQEQDILCEYLKEIHVILNTDSADGLTTGANQALRQVERRSWTST